MPRIGWLWRLYAVCWAPSASYLPAKIAALRGAVFAYVDAHPKDWRFCSIVHIDGFRLEEGYVRLAM